MVLVINPVEFL